jgi:hypothetical protein
MWSWSRDQPGHDAYGRHVSVQQNCFANEATMTDEHAPTAGEQLSEIKSTVADGVKIAATTIKDAIEEGRKPGNSLDTLSKVVRQAPLAALVVAFLIGRASKRRW